MKLTTDDGEGKKQHSLKAEEWTAYEKPCNREPAMHTAIVEPEEPQREDRHASNEDQGNSSPNSRETARCQKKNP